MIVHKFDDTTESGSGYIIGVFTDSAPIVGRIRETDFYVRELKDNSPVGKWKGPYKLKEGLDLRKYGKLIELEILGEQQTIYLTT